MAVSFLSCLRNLHRGRLHAARGRPAGGPGAPAGPARALGLLPDWPGPGPPAAGPLPWAPGSRAGAPGAPLGTHEGTHGVPYGGPYNPFVSFRALWILSVCGPKSISLNGQICSEIATAGRSD